MCRRCVICKGRSVGKSTDVGESELERMKVALGMAAHGYIRQRLREVTDPRNRPPLALTSRQALGTCAKDPVPPGALTPIYDVGCEHPIAWKDSEGGVYGRDGKKLWPGKKDKCPPDAIIFCEEACPKYGFCRRCCDCEKEKR